jgi:CRISPR-associated endonuclease/helicase Cas3
VTEVLTADDFPAFFRCVHGVDPFPWQTRLLRDRVAAPEGWPAILDLPTGSGKTAALDIALFHLALEAENGAARRAPLRIAFVVDRRLIVDDAYLRAKRIEAALAKAASDTDAPAILRTVAARLGRLAERPDHPLLARRMRGGMPREDDWARTPCQPTILCSTVDQVGSRLLFRGYGVSDSMKPVHAGLLGSDCLILLDEAHLSEPFRQTLKAVDRHRAATRDAGTAPAAPFGVALLTATPGAVSDKTFALEQDDRDHPVLRRRLAAAKPARLVSIAGRKDDPADDSAAGGDGRRIGALVDAVRSAFDHLATEKLETEPVVGVVVNRVLCARSVFRRLREIYGPAGEGEPPRADVLLVIGPAREADAEALGLRLDPIKTGRDAERLALPRPLIVVATQTIEAGVDLDFDALVTEVASLDALKQRFGRLNRAGRGLTPYAAILADRDDERPGKDGDPVYGQAAAATWEALADLTKRSSGGARIDFGASPPPGMPWVGEIWPTEIERRCLLAPRADAPVVMPAYVDLWSQTSPVPHADPEVSLFLHGPDRSSPTVLIVWRADLELDRADFDAKALLKALFTAMPPKPAEAVEVSLGAARRWLRGEAGVDLADAPSRDEEAQGTGRGRPAFRWAGPDNRATDRIYANGLKPNDLIVVPADYGGCDEFGWDPGSERPVKDVADQAARRFSARRFALRLTPELIRAAAPADGAGDAAAAAAAEAARFAAALIEVMTELREGYLKDNATAIISALLAADPPGALREALEPLASRAKARPQAIFPYGLDQEERRRGVVLVAPKGIRPTKSEAEAELEGGTPATEDDWSGSASGVAQSLDEHSREVRDLATAFAEGAGLGDRTACDVAVAAYLHDAGKADPRFQAMLYGGDRFSVDDAKILAKSAHRVDSAWARAGLPDHWRHEALSVRIAREHTRFGSANDHELVLWLIGVHHGYGRPFFPHADESAPERLPNVLGGLRAAAGPGPQSLAFRFNGWDWPQIFERLKRRYGVWELARLEAIVRLADHRASEVAIRQAEAEGAQ